MAQIHVFGHVGNPLVPQQSQSNSTYVCFYLNEQTGKGRNQSYQVWAWNEDVSRLIQKKVQKGSFIWLTGTLELVDCTTNQGKERTKILKVYLTNWGFVPTGLNRHTSVTGSNDLENTVFLPSAEVLDGERVSLPE